MTFKALLVLVVMGAVVLAWPVPAAHGQEPPFTGSQVPGSCYGLDLAAGGGR